MPPKLTAAEIEARDAARLNELGYKQVHNHLCIWNKSKYIDMYLLGTEKRTISRWLILYRCLCNNNDLCSL